MVMRHQFNPGHARRWPGNATLDERLAKTVLHEPGLMLRCIPHLHHDKVTTFVEPRRMGHKTVWPVTLPGGLVDAERCVNRVVFLRSHTLELQDHSGSHTRPPQSREARGSGSQTCAERATTTRQSDLEPFGGRPAKCPDPATPSGGPVCVTSRRERCSHRALTTSSSRSCRILHSWLA